MPFFRRQTRRSPILRADRGEPGGVIVDTSFVEDVHLLG